MFEDPARIHCQKLGVDPIAEFVVEFLCTKNLSGIRVKFFSGFNTPKIIEIS